MRHETGFRIDAVSLVRLAGMAGSTRVITPEGEVAINALRRGDRVITRAGAMRMIVAEARHARVAPIRIAAGALGPGLPSSDLLVGPATRIWLPRQPKPFEARRLVDGAQVTEEPPRGMTLWTLVFATPQVVQADGIEVCV